MNTRPRKPNTIASSLTREFQDPRLGKRIDRIPVPDRLNSLKRQKFSLFDEMKLFFSVIKAGLNYQTILLFSSRGYLKPELLATFFFSILPEILRPKLIFYGEMFQPNSGIRGIIEKWIMRYVGRAVSRFIVYSKQDLDTFAATWGIDRSKIRVNHYYCFRTKNDPLPEAGQRVNQVFAGGKSFRDYEPVIEAARQLPELNFYLATDSLDGRDDLPKNVHAGIVSLEEYYRLVNTSAVVLMPLQMGLKRSTGMLTYLEAMWAKNPIIITNALGVSEYVENGVTGLIVDGTADGYLEAIRWIFNPVNSEKIKSMCENAHAQVLERFTLTNHVTRLLEIIDELDSQANSLH